MKIMHRGLSARRFCLPFLIPIVALVMMLMVATGAVASETVTLYATQDARVEEGDASNHGNAQSLFVNQPHDDPLFPVENKTFIGGFDIASLPANAIIEFASLCLYGTRVSGDRGVEIAVQRAMDPWTESEINWYNMPDRSYHTNSGTNVLSEYGVGNWHHWNVKVYVQDWIDGIYPNYGFALIALDNNGGAFFSSKDYGAGEDTPYLVVEYTKTPDSDDNPVWLNQYFPLMVNNSWTYGGITTVNISVDGIERVNGVQTKKVYRSDQDAYVFFTQDEEGTRRFKEEIPTENLYGIFEPPLKELPANAFVGKTYSYSSTEKVYSSSGAYQGEQSCEFTTNVLGFENVTLSSAADINGNPYSSFPDCLKLSHTLRFDGVSMSETCWYAKDLGMVKISGQYGTVQLRDATTYYDGTLSGVWRGRILDSDGVHQGDLDLTLTQAGSNLSGSVGIDLNNGTSYSLPIQNGYASGPNAVANASDGTNSFDFALTHNGDYLTGPYNSSFMGYGNLQGFNGSGDDGGCVTVDNSLNLSIQCAEYSGLQVEATLNHYVNPSDPFGIYWELGNANAVTCDCGGECTTVDNALKITIPCLVYNDVQYDSIVMLEQYINAQNPFGLYWKFARILEAVELFDGLPLDGDSSSGDKRFFFNLNDTGYYLTFTITHTRGEEMLLFANKPSTGHYPPRSGAGRDKDAVGNYGWMRLTFDAPAELGKYYLFVPGGCDFTIMAKLTTSPPKDPVHLLTETPINSDTSDGDKLYYVYPGNEVEGLQIKTYNTTGDVLDLGINLPSTGHYPITAGKADVRSTTSSGDELIVLHDNTWPRYEPGAYTILVQKYGSGGAFTIKATRLLR